MQTFSVRIHRKIKPQLPWGRGAMEAGDEDRRETFHFLPFGTCRILNT